MTPPHNPKGNPRIVKPSEGGVKENVTEKKKKKNHNQGCVVTIENGFRAIADQNDAAVRSMLVEDTGEGARGMVGAAGMGQYCGE
jgi:hypothetical protein